MKTCFDDLIKKANSLEDLCSLVKEAEKVEDNSGLVRFGDLVINDWFEYNKMFYRKVDVCIAYMNGESDYDGNFAIDDMVCPIEIRKKVLGEVSVEIDADDVCDIFDCCKDCMFKGSLNNCTREKYTWTLTATPKKI